MFLGNNHNASLYISLCIDHNNVVLNTKSNVIKKQIVAAAQIVQVNITWGLRIAFCQSSEKSLDVEMALGAGKATRIWNLKTFLKYS